MGFLIIDECPSVDTDNFTPTLLRRHQESLSELIRRDKNRPSVVMWSIANEPRTGNYEAGMYFKQVAQHTRYLDSTRPITMAIAVSYDVRIPLSRNQFRKRRSPSFMIIFAMPMIFGFTDIEVDFFIPPIERLASSGTFMIPQFFVSDFQ